MPIVEIKGPERELKIETEAKLSSADGHIARLNQAFESYNALVPLSKIEFVRDEEGPPAVYKLDIETMDGREWHQEITFDTADPRSTYDVDSTGYRLSEVRGRRVIDATLIELVPIWRPIKIEATWSS